MGLSALHSTAIKIEMDIGLVCVCVCMSGSRVNESVADAFNLIWHFCRFYFFFKEGNAVRRSKDGQITNNNKNGNTSCLINICVDTVFHK